MQILVVDDNRDAADSVAMLLRLCGAEVNACYDGLTALHVAEWFGPDVAILDINMPGMNGLELASRLRKWSGEIPLFLVALTALSDSTMSRQIMAAGFDRHFVKPVHPDTLLEAFSEHLIQKRRAQTPLEPPR